MNNNYRRREPASRLEGLLARLVRGEPRPRPQAPRVDLGVAEPVLLEGSTQI
jgi:hypothetical protein